MSSLPECHSRNVSFRSIIITEIDNVSVREYIYLGTYSVSIRKYVATNI